MESVTHLSKDTISGLQDLIRINIDSSKGFTTVAQQVESKPLADLFRQCAAERDTFAGQIQRYVAINAEDPADSGTVKGTMHRWWTNIRGTVQNGSEYAMLAEAERGEDAIKERYEDVIRKTAGNPLNNVLLEQYAAVKTRHDQIRDLRDARA